MDLFGIFCPRIDRTHPRSAHPLNNGGVGVRAENRENPNIKEMSASLPFANAAPCRHRGAPRPEVVEHVLKLLSSLAKDQGYLASHGLTGDEYSHALPLAVEKLRGRMAASNQERRDFVEEIVSVLVDLGVVLRYKKPTYGKDTVYRLFMSGGMQVGLIQKGCPDGKHSSVAWSRPDWADELYLWWVCDSKNLEPGEHVWKGVNRVRGKVSAAGEDQLDGLIFYNQLCGTPDRPCPKMEHAIERNGIKLPPPCIYVFPRWDHSQSLLNWRGETQRVFPRQLLSAFGIEDAHVANFTGHIGFRLSGGEVTRTEVTSRYGASKATTAWG